MNVIIGSHVSFTNDKQLLGSVLETISYNATAFMFYTGAPQNTKRSKINNELTKEAHELMKKSNIKLNNVVVHAPYLINLATITNRDFAISFLKQEIERSLQLGIKKIILHPGSHVGIGNEKAIDKIVEGLNIVMENNEIIICLESMSTKGTEIGTIDELINIYNKVIYKDRIQICLDTCHLFDAGYDISNFDLIIDEIENKIGKNKIGCIHINDSKNINGSKKDRHANIGEGNIGIEILKKIVNNKKLESVPKILETPWIKNDEGKLIPPYKKEIQMLISRGD